MNRKERRRAARAEQRRGMSFSAPPAAGPAFGAADALTFLTAHKRSAPVPVVVLQAPPAPEPPPQAEAAEPPSLPPAVPRPFSASNVEVGAYYRAIDAARGAAHDDRATAMVAAVRDYADATWADLRPSVEAPGTAPIACTAGCAWCCHQQVAIMPVEAVAIAKHVEEHFAPTPRGALMKKLRELDEVTRGKTASERARLKKTCAFIIDGQCSIYEARPLRCRGVHSRDWRACRTAMDEPETAAARRERRDPGPFVTLSAKVMDAALKGLARACRDVGLEADSLELTAAARIALAIPEIEAVYAAGEPVFVAAALPLPPAEPPVPPPAADSVI